MRHGRGQILRRPVAPLQTVQPFPRTMADSVAVGADTLSRTVGRPRTLADTVAVGTDALVRSLVLGRSFKDFVGLAPNLVLNPSFEYDTVGAAPAAWTGWASPTTFAVRASQAISGSKALHIAGTSPANFGVVGAIGPAMAVTPGESVSYGVYFTLNTFPAGAYTIIYANVYDSSQTILLSQPNVGGSAGGWWTASVQLPARAAYVQFAIGVGNLTGTPFAVDFSIDAAGLFEVGAWPGYFDGDSPGAYWAGTPGASRSYSTFTDAIQVSGARPRTSSDTVAVSDALTRLSARARALADSVAVGADALVRAGYSPQRYGSDVVVVGGDTLTRLSALARSLGDAVVVGDVLSRLASQARLLGDTAAVSDTLGRLLGSVRGLSDSVSAPTDSIARTAAYGRTAADSVTVGDVLQRAALARARQFADSAAVADAITRLAADARTLGDAVAVGTDQVVRTGTRARILADSVSVADAIVATLGKTRTSGDTVSVADSLSRIMSAARNMGDLTVISGDSIARSWTAARTLVDAVVINDALIRNPQGLVRFLDEPGLSVGDSLGHIAALARSLADSLLVMDRLDRAALPQQRTAQDALAVLDVLAGRLTVTRGLHDTVAVSPDLFIQFVRHVLWQALQLIVSEQAAGMEVVERTTELETAHTVQVAMIGETR